MKKRELIDLFGSQAEVGRMIGVSRAAISEWDDKLSTRQADEIVGACLRTRKWTYEAIVSIWPEYGWPN